MRHGASDLLTSRPAQLPSVGLAVPSHRRTHQRLVHRSSTPHTLVGRKSSSRMHMALSPAVRRRHITVFHTFLASPQHAQGWAIVRRLWIAMEISDWRIRIPVIFSSFRRAGRRPARPRLPSYFWPVPW